MYADPLSDVLSLLDVRSIATNGLQAGGEWAFRFPPPQGLKYVLVTRGSAWIYSERTEALPIQEGDVLLLNGSAGYVIASAPSIPPSCAGTIFKNAADGIGRFGDPEVVMLGGRVSLDERRCGLILDMLPPLIHVPVANAAAGTARWMIDELSKEIDRDRPGSGGAISQLTQLIMMQALRVYLESEGETAVGWLRGLADMKIAPALALMHAEPAQDWRLDELARAVGMSRTAFAMRFKSITGTTPLAYLSRWRMHLAQRALAKGAESIGVLGRSLGYASEAAFSAAFKRAFGMPPRDYSRARAKPIESV